MRFSGDIQFIRQNFRDNPKLGDGNSGNSFTTITVGNLNFRDNPKLGDGNMVLNILQLVLIQFQR